MAKPGGAATGRRERKKQQTRALLTEAALELFAQRGFEGTRVEDITARAGVAVGTFFNYFPAKDAVLQDVQRRSLEEAIGHARSLDIGSARGRFLRQFRFLAERAGEQGGQLTRVFFGRLMASPRITAPNRPLVYRLFDIYAGWIEDARESGEVRRDTDAMTAAVMLHELWSHTALRWSTHPSEIDLVRRMRDRVDIVFDGIGAGNDASSSPSADTAVP